MLACHTASWQLLAHDPFGNVHAGHGFCVMCCNLWLKCGLRLDALLSSLKRHEITFWALCWSPLRALWSLVSGFMKYFIDSKLHSKSIRVLIDCSYFLLLSMWKHQCCRFIIIMLITSTALLIGASTSQSSGARNLLNPDLFEKYKRFSHKFNPLLILFATLNMPILNNAATSISLLSNRLLFRQFALAGFWKLATSNSWVLTSWMTYPGPAYRCTGNHKEGKPVPLLS